MVGWHFFSLTKTLKVIDEKQKGFYLRFEISFELLQLLHFVCHYNMIVTKEGQPWKTEIFLCRFVECLPREPFTFTPPYIKGRHIGILLYKTQLINQAFYLDLALVHCIENVKDESPRIFWIGREKGLWLFEREARYRPPKYHF